MKIVLLLLPILLFAATKEECTKMLERFEPLEKAYDALTEAKVASPVAEQVIRDFREEGNRIYTACRDKMSTTRWYMLGKKVAPQKVDIAKYHLPSLAELEQYAVSHPPVVTEYRCGTVIQQGIKQPRPGLLRR